MRFFLDQNVDARLGSFLRSEGHDAWSADDSGLGRETDPNLTIYAHDRRAALLTHDREFSRRSQQHVIGQHIWLDCTNIAAREVMRRHLRDLLPILEHHADMFVALHLD